MIYTLAGFALYGFLALCAVAFFVGTYQVLRQERWRRRAERRMRQRYGMDVWWS